jgi:hypothetical protein
LSDLKQQMTHVKKQQPTIAAMMQAARYMFCSF